MGPGRETPGVPKPGGPRPEYRSIKKVKFKKNITKKITKQIETVLHYILHAVALANNGILIRKNTSSISWKH